MTQRTWGGRFAASPAEAMLELSASIDVDQKMWREDITGSLAHARGLRGAGVLSNEEYAQIEKGLEEVAKEIEGGTFRWDPAKEDVHMNIEARLIEIIGPLGGKLHTGRSRNDQVATDARLYAKRRCEQTKGLIDDVLRAIVFQAKAHVGTLLPGYTHLQRAQPIRLSHHLLAWFEMLERDRSRLNDALLRLNEMPLGCGALAGTTFPINREEVCRDLGFARPMRNSLDATASRDFMLELGSVLAILGVHLSRIGEELVLWSSQEFGFVELDDTFSTGSSMMPQKKNPDVAELVRGRSSRTIGNAVTLFVLEKGLCFGYNRDMQEDKVTFFDSFDTTDTSLAALAGALRGATFSPEKMAIALKEGFVCATEVADYLADKGVPFREAHEITGKLVREAIGRDVALEGLSLKQFKAANPAFGEDIFEALKPEVAVERRNLIGGPAKAQVEAQLSAAEERI